MKKLLLTVIVAVFVFGFSGMASAVVINPGDSNVIPVSAVFSALSVTLLDSNLNQAWNSGTIQGLASNWVYRDNSDNNLIFAYQVSNTVTDPLGDGVKETSHINFKGFTTDVFYEIQVAGQVAPTKLDRTLSGSTLDTFYDTIRANEITPGKTSAFFWIKTNAQYYGLGQTSIIDGGSANIVSFSPTVPEPATLSLLGLGILGLLGFRKRKV